MNMEWRRLMKQKNKHHGKRIAVYQKYGGKCAYCGKHIEYKDMQVDHIKPKRQDGTDDMDNLSPTCRLCNHYKRSLDLEGYREHIATLHERIRKPYINRVAERYGIVEVNEWDGTFYFERYKGRG